MCWRVHHTFVSFILDKNHLVHVLNFKESADKLFFFSEWMRNQISFVKLCIVKVEHASQGTISKTHFYMWIFIFYSCLLFFPLIPRPNQKGTRCFRFLKVLKYWLLPFLFWKYSLKLNISSRKVEMQHGWSDYKDRDRGLKKRWIGNIS